MSNLNDPTEKLRRIGETLNSNLAGDVAKQMQALNANLLDGVNDRMKPLSSAMLSAVNDNIQRLHVNPLSDILERSQLFRSFELARLDASIGVQRAMDGILRLRSIQIESTAKWIEKYRNEMESVFSSSLQRAMAGIPSKIFDDLYSQRRLFGEISLPESNEQDTSGDELADSPTASSAYTSEEVKVEDEATDIAREINARLVIVQYLPFKILRAVTENPYLMKGLRPREFEELIAELLNQHDFENIILTERSGDGGRDVIATKRFLNVPMLFAFECKQYSKNVGVEKLRTLLGTISHGRTKANIGVLATTAKLTRGARDFIAHEPMLSALEFNDLVEQISAIKHRIIK